jgi:glycosyltransferase involved in cell wall biosynthesis
MLQMHQESKQFKTTVNSHHILHILLFDLSIYGHHPAYIRHLLNYWNQQALAGHLTVLVSPRFFLEHADVIEFGKQLDSKKIQFLAITEAEEAHLKLRTNGVNRNIRNFQEWQLLCKYTRQLQVDHALVMYYDTYQYYLALNFNPPCLVSGIYFRPTFHYKHFSNNAISFKEGLKIYWEKLVLSRVLKNSKLYTLFSLDPFVTKYVNPDVKHSKLVYLPDPVELHQESNTALQNLREQLGIEPNRKLFLIFGALTERKGINQLLDALALLSPDFCEQLAVVMIGEASASYRQHIEARIQDLVQHHPIQIVRHYQFIPEEDVQKYFQTADVVLAPYQQHVGMSGILIQAAAAQKPVLSSDYGLMGELVKQYQLGLAVNSTQPRAIAEGIQEILYSKDLVSNVLKMQQFADQNSASQFASVIFNRLMQVNG